MIWAFLVLTRIVYTCAANGASLAASAPAQIRGVCIRTDCCRHIHSLAKKAAFHYGTAHQIEFPSGRIPVISTTFSSSDRKMCSSIWRNTIFDLTEHYIRSDGTLYSIWRNTIFDLTEHYIRSDANLIFEPTRFLFDLTRFLFYLLLK